MENTVTLRDKINKFNQLSSEQLKRSFLPEKEVKAFRLSQSFQNKQHILESVIKTEQRKQSFKKANRREVQEITKESKKVLHTLPEHTDHTDYEPIPQIHEVSRDMMKILEVEFTVPKKPVPKCHSDSDLNVLEQAKKVEKFVQNNTSKRPNVAVSKMNKEAAIKFLSDKSAGSFLLRGSSNASFACVLMVKTNERIFNISVMQSSKGFYLSPDLHFPTLNDLVLFYTENEITCNQNSSFYLKTYLTA